MRINTLTSKHEDTYSGLKASVHCRKYGSGVCPSTHARCPASPMRLRESSMPCCKGDVVVFEVCVWIHECVWTLVWPFFGVHTSVLPSTSLILPFASLVD